MDFMKKLYHFTVQQALSCVFPAAIFITLAVSKLIHIPYWPRYDFIFMVCLVVQYLMVRLKLETIDELKVICMFHVIGLALELYKVHMGSWSYPEHAYFKIGGVPLYSGFMYASVASYICQAWKRFELRFYNWPGNLVTYTTAAAIYLNFFTHHYIPDSRWYITAILFIVFGKAYVTFKVEGLMLKMPVILSFFLIGFFIWVAENISTFFGAWTYPNQAHAWRLVHIGKISSWFLLVIISIVIVVNLKHIKYGKNIEKAE